MQDVVRRVERQEAAQGPDGLGEHPEKEEPGVGDAQRQGVGLTAREAPVEGEARDAYGEVREAVQQVDGEEAEQQPLQRSQNPGQGSREERRYETRWPTSR